MAHLIRYKLTKWDWWLLMVVLSVATGGLIGLVTQDLQLQLWTWLVVSLVIVGLFEYCLMKRKKK